MKRYREDHPAYRERERLRRGRLRRDAEAGFCAVTEAGLSSHEPARVYLVTGLDLVVRLHAVTASGRVATVCAEAATEAGSKAVVPVKNCAPRAAP
jgi:hypothetical protein